MTEYILLFRNASAENGYLSTTQDMAEDMPKWQSWIGNIAMQGKLVSTAPIRYDASIVDNSGVKQQRTTLQRNKQCFGCRLSYLQS